VPADLRWTERDLIEQVREWIGVPREWEVRLMVWDEKGKRRPFRMQQGWIYSFNEEQQGSQEMVTVIIQGANGKQQTHQLGVGWSGTRVRAEIADAMNEVDEENNAIEIKDENGHPQYEWAIKEGWTYRIRRGRRTRQEEETREQPPHGGVMKGKRIDTGEEFELAYTSDDTGESVRKALEERMGVRKVRLITQGSIWSEVEKTWQLTLQE
jgi:hypothetical protein